MANTTPAALITSIANTARMQVGVASADRALILGWLQEAVDIIAFDVEAIHDATPTIVSLVAGQSEYNLTASPFAISGFIAIDEMRLSDSASTNIPLMQVPMVDLDYARAGAQANATPYVYSVDYPMIVFHPTPAAGTTVEVRTVVDGPTLADDTAPITFIPSALQYGCLKEWALYRALEYKKQPEAVNHQNNFLNSTVNGIRAARRWVERSGGRQPMSGLGIRARRSSPSQDFGPVFPA